MFCRLLALFGIYIYIFVTTDNSRLQPRPQGAFPWLWSYGKGPWGPRLTAVNVGVPRAIPRVILPAFQSPGMGNSFPDMSVTEL